jgi:hypothetical protein
MPTRRHKLGLFAVALIALAGLIVFLLRRRQADGLDETERAQVS